MTNKPEAASEVFGEIARALEDMDDVPEALVELVELAADEDAEADVLKTAAELMSPSDRRAVRAFCVQLRDGNAASGDVVLAESFGLLDAILADTEGEWDG